MKEEVIFRMESAYREDFEVKSYHFGGPEKTMCIIGNMRCNEIQQLYIAGQMVRTLKRFEEEGRFIRRHGVDRKSTRLNSSHKTESRMPSSA